MIKVILQINLMLIWIYIIDLKETKHWQNTAELFQKTDKLNKIKNKLNKNLRKNWRKSDD